MSNYPDCVSVARKPTAKAGSCNACGRHPEFDPDAPRSVLEIEIGDPERHSTSIRLCDRCWANLVEKGKRI